MSTVADLIASSMRLCGSLSPGETPNASELADFLLRLNDIIDEANTDRMNLLPPVSTTLTAASAKAAYQIGPSGTDFNRARPLVIQNLAHVVGGIQHDVELIDSSSYASIRDRAATSVVVLRAYCDYAFPIATINVWPIPSATPTFQMFAWTVVAPFAATSDTVSLPTAWFKFLQWALAVNIAPDLGTPDNILATLAPIALAAKSAVQALNKEYLATARGNSLMAMPPTIGVPSGGVPGGVPGQGGGA